MQNAEEKKIKYLKDRELCIEVAQGWIFGEKCGQGKP